MRIRFASILLPALAQVQVLILLAACALPGRPAPMPAEPTAPPPTPSPTAEATAVSPLAILVIPADMAQDQSNLYQSIVYDLAQQAGMRFQVRNALATSEVSTEAGLRLVIALPPDPGLAGLAAAAPQVQFLGVGIPGLTSAANLSVIGTSDDTVTQQAFLAGYIASMLALDYRVGLITPETDAGKKVIEAFANGRTFYCGLCNSAFPPYTYKYPAHPEIPVGTPLSQYPFYSDYLLDYLVEVAYVDPQIATPELLDYMAQRGLKIIGEQMPFESLRSNWIASISPDIITGIQRLWPDLVAGRGGQNLSTPLFLTDINPDLLSEGKQRLVEEILSDLQAGYIDPGVKP